VPEKFIRNLPPTLFEHDIRRLREGYYTDAYFSNTVQILTVLSEEGYLLEGIPTGDLEVEMQFFPRRRPFAVVCGVEESLAILRECAGYFDSAGKFVSTYAKLEIEAVPDGTLTPYAGDSLDVNPVLKVRGRYRDFAKLETPILGVLTEGSKIATNAYNTLIAAKGKDIYFFPARFTHYKVQPLHGYAYSVAVQAYNETYKSTTRVLISTDAQGTLIGLKGGGTISHASIACFLGNTTETMLQFCRIMPSSTPRIALIDFHNDCVREAKNVAKELFGRYLTHLRRGDVEEAERYVLYGVRPDTAGNMRDASVLPTGDPEEDYGVNPRLVHNIRNGLDSAWQEWELDEQAEAIAEQYCKNVKIIVTGGFNIARITKFEQEGVPVDIYGVGSSLLENTQSHSTDFTGDIVRAKVAGAWVPLAKLGRRQNDNGALRLVED